MDCPNCNALGCGHCERGKVVLSECPQLSVIDGEMRDLVELTGLFYEGLPPCAGGVNDQDHWFIDAARFLKHEQSHFT